MYQFNFEKLDVWQKSKALAKSVYTLTKDFPDSEKWGLTNQLRRAVISISSNIAEGGARSSSKDQAHFYNMAYGSLMEVLSQLLVSVELEYTTEERVNELRTLIAEISNKLNALRKAVLRNV